MKRFLKWSAIVVLVVLLWAAYLYALTPEQAKTLSVGDKVHVKLTWSDAKGNLITYLEGDGTVTSYDVATGVAGLDLITAKGQRAASSLHFQWITAIISEAPDTPDIVSLKQQIMSLTAENVKMKADMNRISTIANIYK